MLLKELINHRHARLLRLYTRDFTVNKLYPGNLGCANSLALLVFILLIFPVGLISVHSSYFLGGSNVYIWLLGLIFPAYGIISFFRVISVPHVTKFNIFKEQIYYWCYYLFKKDMISMILEPFMLKEFVVNNTDGFEGTFLRMVPHSLSCFNYKFEKLLISTSNFNNFASALSIRLKNFKRSSNIQTLMWIGTSTFFLLIGLFICTVFAFFTLMTTSMMHRPSFLALMILVSGFMITLISTNYLIQAMVAQQARALALKLILYEVFFRYSNCDYELIGIEQFSDKLQYEEINYIIRYTMYGTNSTDSPTRTQVKQ